MAAAALRFQNDELLRFLDDLYNKFDDIRPLLERWGVYQQGRVKRRFQEAGPGWPKKHAYFAELERRTTGGGQVPLTYRGRLAGSITYDVGSRGQEVLRVGSPLRYAARHQFGDDKMYFFYLYIQADHNPDGSVQRDEQGRILGKLVLRQAAEGAFRTSINPEASARSQKAASKKVRSIYRQRIGVMITARPFLLEPDQGEERDMIEMAEKFLIDESGKEGKA